MNGEKVSFISTTYKAFRLEGHTMCPVHRTYYFQLILYYRAKLERFDNTPPEGLHTPTLITFDYLT